MKRVFFIVSLLIYTSNLFSQVTIELYDGNDGNENNVTNSTIHLVPEQTYHLKIMNLDSKDITVTGNVTDINLPVNMGQYGCVEICMFGTCVNVTNTQQIGVETTILQGGFMYSDADHIIYYPDGGTGPANLTFTISEVGNSANSVYVIYDTEYADVENINKANRVYPNPASEQITINSEKDAVLNVFDINGKNILSKKLNSDTETISVNNLQNGMYFYTISKNGKNLSSNKLVVNK